ncbi:ceramide kinase-like, partial [Tropilaelaps mercedesae]
QADSTARIYFAEQTSAASVLRLRSLQLEFETIGARDRFVTTVRRALETLRERPRRLLIFINPFGGRRRARAIYNKKAAPVFQICGIKCKVVITTHSGHSKEYVMDKDLSAYDGVVCVGGDGMANELINGIMQRTLKSADAAAAATAAIHQLEQEHQGGVGQENNNNNNKSNNKNNDRLSHRDVENNDDFKRDSGEEADIQGSCFELPKSSALPIGVIPAGSTDALVCTTTGAHCPLNSALHVAIG